MLRLSLLWLAWCLLHSLLIATPVKRWFGRQGGLLLAAYRLGYVIIAILTLLPILWYMSRLEQQPLFAWHGKWRLLQCLLLAYSAIMFYGGARVYDTGYFLGFKQWMDYRVGRAPCAIPFRDSGILAWVRHPWYSGSITLLWGLGPLTNVTLVSKLLLTGYLLIGTLLEEEKLKAELGERYAQYIRQVPMLIPKPPKDT